MSDLPSVQLPPALLRVPALALWRLLDRLQGEDPAKNPWLSGNFAPVDQEQRLDDLPVLGEVPGPVQGFYLRNGANPRFWPRGGYHWFDGDGMIHGLRLWGDRARYLNRYVRTARLAVEEAFGEPVYGKLGDLTGKLGVLRVLLDQARKAIGAVPAEDRRSGTANTALLAWRGQVLALHEASWPYALRATDEGDLVDEGPMAPPFGGPLDLPVSAHPKVDPVTGELCFLSYQVQGQPVAAHVTVGPDGALRGVVPLALAPPPMIHDFAITARYSVLPDLPFVFEPEAMIRGDGAAFQFHPERPARLGLLPRGAEREAEVRWFTIAPCFVFHWCNAWEEGEDVVVVGGRLPRFSLRQTAENRPTPWKWRLRADGRVEEGPLCAIEADFPAVHPGRVGRPAEVGWFATVIQHADGLPRMDGVARVNLHSGTLEGQIKHGEAVYGGELSFVPEPGGGDGDGWLVGFVHDERAGVSSLRVYDARCAEARPVAEVPLPVRVPYGFHGLFLGAQG